MPVTRDYLIEFERLCICFSNGQLGWGDFKHAIEELNKTIDSNARVL